MLDVAGAVGVKVTMESNNLKINIQGNELRDAPLNRDGKVLNNSEIWIDRRALVQVAKGVNGYERERWYTAGGLLEVGGYLGTERHGIGEWAAIGGTVTVEGGELVARRGRSSTSRAARWTWRAATSSRAGCGARTAACTKSRARPATCSTRACIAASKTPTRAGARAPPAISTAPCWRPGSATKTAIRPDATRAAWSSARAPR
ncbi:hypothetical protein WJ973_20900 [Achromobacter xylosoxidans]